MNRDTFGTCIANDVIAEIKRANAEKFLVEIGVVTSRNTKSRPGDIFRSAEDIRQIRANEDFLRSIEEFPAMGRKIAA